MSAHPTLDAQDERDAELTPLRRLMIRLAGIVGFLLGALLEFSAHTGLVVIWCTAGTTLVVALLAYGLATSERTKPRVVTK
jgi:hypothetical protein